ncbi:hypothetical protein [Pseudomonas syringae]|uniref:hypothetical protein n=1 Tax=Pseudomonas syringae TaxID=317 RepID=UPI0009B022E8|nr:hypothetical protein [Pseudomonas syringae]
MQTADQRLTALEQATNSLLSASTNALSAIVKTVSQLESVDRETLREDLEQLKTVQIQNGNQAIYSEFLSIVQSNIS